MGGKLLSIVAYSELRGFHFGEAHLSILFMLLKYEASKINLNLSEEENGVILFPKRFLDHFFTQVGIL